MEEVPKIVAQRLRVAAGAEDHLDANLLAAFAEKSLTSREQARVLDHLANCAVCREVVAHSHAGPAVQRVAAAAAPARKRESWFQAPVLRWGALAACVAVIGTVVISRSNRSSQAPVMNASKTPEATIAMKLEPAAPAPPPATIASSETSRQNADKADVVTRRRLDEAPNAWATNQAAQAGAAGERSEKKLQAGASLPSSGIAGGQGDGLAIGSATARADDRRLTADGNNVGGPVPMPRRDLAGFMQLTPGVAAPATPNKGAEVATRNGAPAAAQAQLDLARVMPPSPQAAPKAADKEVSTVEAKAEAMKAPMSTNETVQVESAAPPVATKAESGNTTVAVNSQPIVTLPEQQKQTMDNSTAVLYKSKDDIVSRSTVGMMHSKVQIPKPRWQISADGKLLRSNDTGDTWQQVPVAANVVFRALCITGAEVWVGGTQGSLFYSSDAGGHFEQVKPSAKGQVLTADITAIEFADPLHGKLSTADHQTWTTTDGGRTWCQK